MEFMMRKAFILFCAGLMAASAVRVASAAVRHGHKSSLVPVEAVGKLRNANDSFAWSVHASCGQESGNPYDRQTDYLAWSAFRNSGAWDSRNDCP
jgi:hypothetical protein